MFLRTDFKEGDPVRKVANARNLVRMANILEGLQVIGGHVVRNYNAEGLGWLLVIDGASDAGALPADIHTSDRLFAVDSLSRSRLGHANFTGADSVGYQSTRDIHVRHDVCADTAFSGVTFRQLRLYLRVSDTTAAPVSVLGRTASGKLRWVDLTDTCATP